MPAHGRRGDVSRRAGETWHSALDAAAAVAASGLAEEQDDRRQAQQLLRLRLEQLQRRHAGKAARAGRGDEAPQAQPGWSVEAAEALCGVGLAAEQAVQALLAAQKYALGRGTSAAQRADASSNGALAADGGGQSGQPSGNATPAGSRSSGSAEASSTAAQANPPPLIDASRVDAVCRELLDTVLLPVAQLHRALVEAPELLACTPAELRKQVGAGGASAAPCTQAAWLAAAC